MDTLLEQTTLYNPPGVNQQEIEKPSRPIICKEIKTVTATLPLNRVPVADGISKAFTNLAFSNSSQKEKEEKEMLLNLYVYMLI